MIIFQKKMSEFFQPITPPTTHECPQKNFSPIGSAVWPAIECILYLKIKLRGIFQKCAFFQLIPLTYIQNVLRIKFCLCSAYLQSSQAVGLEPSLSIELSIYLSSSIYLSIYAWSVSIAIHYRARHSQSKIYIQRFPPQLSIFCIM